VLRKLVIAGILCLSTIVSATEVDEAQLSLHEYFWSSGRKMVSFTISETKLSCSTYLDDKDVSLVGGFIKVSDFPDQSLDKLGIYFPTELSKENFGYQKFLVFSRILKKGGTLVMDALWEPKNLESVSERLEEIRKELSGKSKVSKTVEELLRLSPENLISSLRKTNKLNPFKQYFQPKDFDRVKSLNFPAWNDIDAYRTQLTTFFESVGFIGLVIDTEKKTFTVTKK